LKNSDFIRFYTDAIDADYMNSRFDKFFKLWQQGDYDQAAMDQVLRNLHKSFAMLSQIEQRYAFSQGK